MCLNGLKKYHYDKLYKMILNCSVCEISIQRYGLGNCVEKIIEEDLENDPVRSTAEHGHIECLKIAHKNGFTMNGNDICNIAAEYGNIECLEYAHENGDKWDAKTCANAANNGHVDVLIYLHENGCAWDTRVCEYPSENNRLNCLIYAHENKCPWDEQTMHKAIQNKNFKCLTYAYENGCPNEIEMIDEACKCNNIEILKYVHKIMKLPFNDLSCTLCVLKNGILECLKYAHKNGGGKLTTIHSK